MELTVVVDRIEAGFAVLEVCGEQVDWPLAALPPHVTEGASLKLTLRLEEPTLDEASARLARLRAGQDDDDDEIDL